MAKWKAEGLTDEQIAEKIAEIDQKSQEVKKENPFLLFPVFLLLLLLLSVILLLTVNGALTLCVHFNNHFPTFPLFPNRLSHQSKNSHVPVRCW